MDEILFIDKPSGITSFDVIRRLRKRLNIKKIGHAGTLDPLATGLLIIGVGNGTKQLEKFMKLPKEYEVLVEFCKVSNTYDADGVIEPGPEPLREISRDVFNAELKIFIGEIEQIPPAFSAKKIQGQRAYEPARRGEKVEMKPNKISIFAIEVMEWNWPFVRLRVRCSKGTYIRSLAHDLGFALGCGGYVKELRRTAIGECRVETAERMSLLDTTF
ncbi:tRNA pseudouridine(55) synthase TruB [Candidatus Peregrinibacteria bacterium]|nr:tRNA pseudouridine(55) synthase TruB [Candidatus Peregrinibacteria bacterium]